MYLTLKDMGPGNLGPHGKTKISLGGSKLAKLGVNVKENGCLSLG